MSGDVIEYRCSRFNKDLHRSISLEETPHSPHFGHSSVKAREIKSVLLIGCGWSFPNNPRPCPCKEINSRSGQGQTNCHCERQTWMCGRSREASTDPSSGATESPPKADDGPFWEGLRLIEYQIHFDSWSPSLLGHLVLAFRVDEEMCRCRDADLPIRSTASTAAEWPWIRGLLSLCSTPTWPKCYEVFNGHITVGRMMCLGDALWHKLQESDRISSMGHCYVLQPLYVCRIWSTGLDAYAHTNTHTQGHTQKYTFT